MLTSWSQRIKQEPFPYKLKLGIIPIQAQIFTYALPKPKTYSKRFGFQPGGKSCLYIGSAWKWVRAGKSLPIWSDLFCDGKGGFQLYPKCLTSNRWKHEHYCRHDFDPRGDLAYPSLRASHCLGDYGGQAPKSSLLINSGNGQFRDETLSPIRQNNRLEWSKSALATKPKRR